MEILPSQASLTSRSENPLSQIALFLFIAIVLAGFAYGVFWTYNLFSLKASSQNPASKNAIQNIQTLNYDERRKSDLATIQRALANYKKVNSVYPTQLNSLVPSYLPVVPIDPETKQNYDYQAGLDQESFQLSATFEDGSEYTVEGN